MRFYTRKKKPKVWSLIAVAVITAAAVVIELNAEKVSVPALSVTLLLAPVCALVILLAAFVRQLKYNPYSYNTIYYTAFSLLALTAIITQVTVLIQLFSGEGIDDSMPVNLVGALASSAKYYMIYSAPFVLVFSCALCLSNISLIRHEGRRPVHFLGILLAFLMAGGEAYLFVSDYYTSGSEIEIIIHDVLTNIFAAVYLYFECMVIGTIIADIIVIRYRPSKDRDYVIVLGCGLRKDGTPTPLLKGRIDRAISFYREQIRETGKAPAFVTSGGQGPDEVISESESMKNYLVENGIPPEHILTEDKSTDTYENMLFSKRIIDEKNPEAKVAFATTNYHVFRSGLKANRVKMHAEGMGAKTRWYFWPNAAVREFVGILTEHRGKQILIFTGMILFYAVMTVIQYRLY